MTSIRKFALACALAAVALLPLAANAQTRSQDTFFTFSQAVELPNVTLQAGTYLFQLADSQSNRHIVRVMSQDRKTVHTTMLAIPFYSLDKPSSDPQVRFMEGPETGPQAVKIWFYPGTATGHELIYPRAQALKLAQRTGSPVLTTKTDGEVAEATDISRVDGTGADAVVTTTADNSAAPPVEPARVETPMPDPAPAPARGREELPRTATVLPLLALLGAGALVSSRLLRRTRRA